MLILYVKFKQAGIKFIGPDADTIDKMGDKIGSRETMQAAGVPVVPGTDEGVASLEEAVQAARHRLSNHVESECWRRRNWNGPL